jgi:hypothetical protein
MADKIKPSLLTLPVELVYRILNSLDDFNIFCTMRDVCTHTNTIMNNYRRYKVKFSAFSLIFFLYFTQTLTTLQLCNTKMDLQGIIQLANTLKQNKVTSLAYVFRSIIYSLLNRPSLHLILESIKSMIKEHIMLPTLYDKIK